MKNNTTTKQAAPKSVIAGKQYSYGEIVEFLNNRWSDDLKDTSLSCIKKLDTAFNSVSKKVQTVFVAGKNGKSITTHFTCTLLQEEGLKVGALYSPHILTYNERLVYNNETIPNKAFTDVGNEVLNAVATLNLNPHALDVLTMMALVYFEKNNVDIAIMEASDYSATNPIMVCKPKVVGITRITDFDATEKGTVLFEKSVKDILTNVTKETHVVSADQSKANLQYIESTTNTKGGTWAMPIRKLAALPYPFEQLHGRCAALAERIAQIYINTFIGKETVIVSNSLLTKTKGQRGRPTLEAKRHAELNPKKTIDQFWREASNSLAGRFQVLDKEKPTILLDTASNLDALENVLLGVRLLHYRRPLKGLTLVVGSNDANMDYNEFFKMIRYFFKKTSGQIIVCPVSPIPGQNMSDSWDADKITNDIKGMKIKAKSALNFKAAFEMAEQSVDERHGLVVVTGSSAIVSQYWRYKGMKKL